MLRWLGQAPEEFLTVRRSTWATLGCRSQDPTVASGGT